MLTAFLFLAAPALAVDKRFVERFLAEAKTTSQAAHPNILNVTDLARTHAESVTRFMKKPQAKFSKTLSNAMAHCRYHRR